MAAERMVNQRDNWLVAVPGWPHCFSHKHFRGAGNEEIHKRPHLLIAELAIKGLGLLVEIRHAGKQVLGPAEDGLLNIFKQASSHPLSADLWCDDQKLQIITDQKIPPDHRNGGDPAVEFGYVAVSSLRKGAKDMIPVG